MVTTMESAQSDTQTRIIDCRECGKTFKAEYFDLGFGGAFMGPTVCDECIAEYEAQYEQRQANALKDARTKTFEEMCPAACLDTDLKKIPISIERFRKALNWQYGPKGLLIHGPTRKGKTRALWLIIRRLMVEESRTVIAIRATEFARQVEKSFKDSTSARHDSFIQSLIDIPILAIDDLDKIKMTSRMQTDLFDIIDDRSANYRPMLITTNAVGDALAERFDDYETGLALVHRLRESCELVSFDDGLPTKTTP